MDADDKETAAGCLASVSISHSAQTNLHNATSRGKKKTNQKKKKDEKSGNMLDIRKKKPEKSSGTC